MASETGGVTTTTTGLFTTSKAWDSFTYKAGLEYDLMSHWMLYGNVSTGYKSGGFYQGAAPDSYDPEHLTAYEIGSKGIYLDGRLEINADAFYYNYKDYQINYIGFINPASAGIFGILTANSEGATAYGGEVEARWLITPNDQCDVSIDPLHAHFKTLVITGIFGGDYSGLPLPFAPSFSSNLGLQHAWPLANGAKLTARAETHIESGSWVTFSEVPNTYVHSLATPIIVIADDGQSAKVTFDSPGLETLSGLGHKPDARHGWCRYGVDFLKTATGWKIWHLHVYGIIFSPFGKSWVDAPGFPPPPKATDVGGEWPKPTRPQSDVWIYSGKGTPPLLPRPPEPDRTFSETFSY